MAMDNDKQAEILHDQSIHVWGHYLKFFTMFWTVNFVAFGLTVQHVHSYSGRLLIALAFIAQNSLTIVSALAMAKYTKTISSKLSELGNQNLGVFQGMAVWGAKANAYAHLVIIAMWGFTIFVSNTPAPDANPPKHKTQCTTGCSDTKSAANEEDAGEDGNQRTVDNGGDISGG